MRPSAKKILLAIFLVALLLPLLAAAMLWGLAGTPGGTRWVADKVAGLSGEVLAWDQVEGTLLDALELRGLRLRQDGLALDIDVLQLAWRPGLLATGVVQVDRLAARGIRVALAGGDSDQAAPATGPFNPADLALPVDIVVAALELGEIELRMGETPPRVIDTLTASARLVDDELTLARLAVNAPEGELNARGRAGLTASLPFELDARWDLQLPQVQRLAGQLRVAGDLDGYDLGSEGQLQSPAADPILWSLAGSGTLDGLRLAPLELRSGPYELALEGELLWAGPLAAELEYRAGAVALAALNPQLPERLDASGIIALRFEDDTLVLEQLDMALAQAPLLLDLRGSVQFPAGGEPVIDGELKWRELQWPLSGEAGVASPEGRVQLAGTPDSWQLELALQTAGSQLPPGSWQGRGEGDRSGLRLDALRGDLLNGTLELAGTAAWAPEPRWQLTIAGKGLEPGAWLPDIPGRLAMELHSEGRVDPERGPQAAVTVQQLTGELLGRPLSLAAKGSLAGEALRLSGLVLRSGENQLDASGELDGQRLSLDWALRAPEPGLLLPGASGVLSGHGRVSGSPASPVVQASLAGQDLGLDGLHLSRLGARLQAGRSPDDPLLLELQLDLLRQGEQSLLYAGRLTAGGTTADHRLDLALAAPSGAFLAGLVGGLDPERPGWTGRLAALTIDGTALGDWRLLASAPLVLAPSGATLGETCLGDATVDSGGEPGLRPAQVCASGDWAPADGARVAAQVRDLALSRLLPGVGGVLSADLDGGMAPAGALDGRGQIDLSPGELRLAPGRGGQVLAHGGGQGRLSVGAQGLEADLVLRPLASGRLQARLSLPRFDRLPLADPQPLEGYLQAELPDLGGLQGWVPALEAVTGRLDADLRLTGNLGQPRLEGGLALSGGAADIPLAGLQLRDIQLRLQDDPAAPGLLRLTGGMSSGEGRLELAGQVDPKGEQLALALTGEAVEVYDTPDARALVSPDLELGWSDRLLRLRGRVLVPRAEITPQLGLRSGGAPREAQAAPVEESQPLAATVIAPSRDVVVLGDEGDLYPATAALPFRLDSRVELALGDRVRVAALGFTGGITGSVVFENAPEQTALVPIANGRLSVEDGLFRAFGQDLQIESGQVIFARVPATEPEVNLRAVRWIDNDPLVSAVGVQVTGPAAAPELELFSRPQLSATEIQSYLLTGHSSSGRDSVLSIGTYLYPKLYVGYGHNLLEQTSEFDALYTITPRWGIDGRAGAADNSVGVGFTYEH